MLSMQYEVVLTMFVKSRTNVDSGGNLFKKTIINQMCLLK